MLSPRTGRPPIHDESRTQASLTLRLTEKEKAKIKCVAESLGISVTDAVIRGIDLLSKSVK